jgi:spore maturation protein CgeB
VERLQPIVAARAKKPWTLSKDVLNAATRQYRRKTLMSLIRSTLVGASTLLFGKERGTRAARRFLYEISWRIFGEATYRARGLPGRLFYGES